MADTLQRRLGVFSAATLIVGSMIGSGIFIGPSIMAGYVTTPGVYLALWLGAGLLTLLGALAYGELCAMMPRAGGQYVFLREAFGPLTGFLYGWTLLLIIQSGFNAAVSIAFAKYLGGVGIRAGERDIVLAGGGIFGFPGAARCGGRDRRADLDQWFGRQGRRVRAEPVHRAQAGRDLLARRDRVRERQGILRKLPATGRDGAGLGGAQARLFG